MRRWQKRAQQIQNKGEESQPHSLSEIVVYLFRDCSIRLFSTASIIWDLAIVLVLPYPFLPDILMGFLALAYFLITFSILGIVIWSFASWVRKAIGQYWNYHSPPHNCYPMSSNWTLFQSNRTAISNYEPKPPEQLVRYSSTLFHYGFYAFLSTILPILIAYDRGILQEAITSLNQSEISTGVAFISVLLGRGLGLLALSLSILLERVENQIPLVVTVLVSVFPMLFIAPAMRNFLEAVERGQKEWLKDRHNPERALLSEIWTLLKLLSLHVGIGFSLLLLYGLLRV